jgi:membrane protein implicated in regulation of membrane protease activity
MIDRKEILARIIVFSTVYVLIAVLVLLYLHLDWLVIPVLLAIFVWDIYVYRMNVRVLGMPLQITAIEGLEGKALTDIDKRGKVKVRGEIWNAESAQLIKKGRKVRIMSRDGILLEVEPVED